MPMSTGGILSIDVLHPFSRSLLCQGLASRTISDLVDLL